MRFSQGSSNTFIVYSNMCSAAFPTFIVDSGYFMRISPWFATYSPRISH